MSFFSDTVAAQLSGQVVTAAILVHFDFLTAPKRVHIGYGPLRSGGHEWSGIGVGAGIAGLEAAIGGIAPQATFSLSGVEQDVIAAALASSQEVKGRDVTVYLQFYHEAGDPPALSPLDEPYAIYAGTMDVMSYKVTGPSLATIAVTAEAIFARRGKPLWGNLSDRDQKRRHTGDELLSRIGKIPTKTDVWPIIIPPK